MKGQKGRNQVRFASQLHLSQEVDIFETGYIKVIIS
jgi:hypothetical protein